MEKILKVMIVDSSDDYLNIFSDLIEEEKDMCVCGVASDGIEAIEMILQNPPDVLITELRLRRLDGLSMIWQLKLEGDMPTTIVVSCAYSEKIAAELDDIGVAKYLSKPCAVEDIVGAIRSAAKPGRTTRAKVSTDYDNAISAALSHAGLSSRLQGFNYYKEAIKLVIEDRTLLSGVTKRLYPDLAKHFGTTAFSIERSMRSALESAWRVDMTQRRADYFGARVFQMKKRPSNSRFIMLVADFVVGENRRINAEIGEIAGALH